MIETAELHAHSKYSIKDAMPSSKDYVDKIYQYNQSQNKYRIVGYAQTDHGVMYGAVKHYNACVYPDKKERIIQPITGCEIYHHYLSSADTRRYHLVLLAATQEGVSNLFDIVSDGGLHVEHGRTKSFPVVRYDYLKEHGKGIIALTACVGGLIPSLIINGKESEALQVYQYFASCFDEVYLEVQPHSFPEQFLVNKTLVSWNKYHGYPLVMTSDSHYIEPDDAQYHDILKNLTRQTPFTTNNHFFTPDEKEEYCLKNEIPLDCISNAGRIAKQCASVELKPKDHNALLPRFPCPDGYDEPRYLRKIAMKGLKEKLVKYNKEDPMQYIRKMLYELDVVCNAGFAGYFLILWDWFKMCRSIGILTGPGRGSAAGSVISYALDITKVDPVKYGFIFERFLNPFRLEFPDIDTDIPRDRRSEAISYLLKRYGQENVSQIITFSKFSLKNTLTPLLTMVGMKFADIKEITKPIPTKIDGYEVTWDFIESVVTQDKYPELDDSDKATIRRLYDKLMALFQKYPIVYKGVSRICGCITNTGIHAGGVIICNTSIRTNAPLIDGGKTAVLPLIQFEMSDLDFFGFLKIDALGLKTLDVIKLSMDMVGLDYDWYDAEDYDDPAVYDLLRSGQTTNVFQMSTYSPRKMLADFNVHTISDLCAVNAGNRPGPLEKDKVTGKSAVDNYIERVKSGTVPSIDPRIDAVLKETYGCIWYQEQCMAIGQIMAGYSLGNSDKRIRKPLCKKQKMVIPEIRNEFVYGKQSDYNEKHEVIGMNDKESHYCVGAIARGFSEELSLKIFETMEAFAKYAFNKPHSFCYAVLAYRTAWLSLYYPVEFIIANCTIETEQEDIIASLSYAKQKKIPILGPDINNSKDGFSLEYIDSSTKAIRYGLRAIKDVGATALMFLIRYRELSHQTFTSFDDYYSSIHDPLNPVVMQLMQEIQERTQKKSPNPMKKDVEVAMILAGVFDCFEPNRYLLLQHYMVDIKKDPNYIMNDKFKDCLPSNYGRKAKLALEMEKMGAYISEHPLDPFPYCDLDAVNEGEQVQIAGYLTKVTSKTLRSGKNTGKEYLTLSFKSKDEKEYNANVFDSELSASLKKDLKKNQILIIRGKYSKQYHNINAKSVKIAIMKKQIMQQEDIEIQNKTSSLQNPFDVPVSDPLQDAIKGIFAQ